jgi:hypothetical protein
MAHQARAYVKQNTRLVMGVFWLARAGSSKFGVDPAECFMTWPTCFHVPAVSSTSRTLRVRARLLKGFCKIVTNILSFREGLPDPPKLWTHPKAYK